MFRYKPDLFTPAGKDAGLLTARLGIGFLFFYVHGLPKIMAGPELWGKLGSAMANYGLSFAPVFWGFMAASAECFGGLLIMAGFLTRPASILLAFTMLTASVMHIAAGDGLSGAAHAMKMMFFFAGLALAGAGNYSVDRLLRVKKASKT